MSRSDTGTSAAALRAAASVGDFGACQHYLKSRRLVHFSCDSEGRSALHLATSGGHRAVIRLLLAVAAPNEVDCADNAGYTSLQIAASQGHEEIIRLLLAHGAKANSSDNVNGNSALHEAAWKGYSRSIRMLAIGGADLNKLNFGSFTPLHLCCQNGHNQTCRELLLAGASPDIQNNYGDTPLHTAARYGHAGVTRILISAQGKVSIQNKNGDTALHIAAAMGRRKLTKILLDAGCDQNARNKQDETAKDIVLRKNLTEVLCIIQNFKENKIKKGEKRSKVKKYKNKSSIEKKSYTEKKQWSPYGCHYYPNSEILPCPRLDSLPKEPLKRGEQYYLDLAGNICKGPVGIGYTCYCAPFFRHLKIRMERDKREFQRAQVKLDQRVTNLELLWKKNLHISACDKSQKSTRRKCSFYRCRSLEMLDTVNKPLLQMTRSMDDVEQLNETNDAEHFGDMNIVGEDNDSETSDEEAISPEKERVKDNAQFRFPSLSNCNIFPDNDLPRYRGPVYSPPVNESVEENSKYMENLLKYKHCNTVPNVFSDYSNLERDDYTSDSEMKYMKYSNLQNQECINSAKYYDQNLNSKLAKLRILDNNNRNVESNINEKHKLDMHYVTSQLQDCIDKDANVDSGYSTKVYGSSKGNSPNLLGQIDNECLGASSLV